MNLYRATVRAFATWRPALWVGLAGLSAALAADATGFAGALGVLAVLVLGAASLAVTFRADD